MRAVIVAILPDLADDDEAEHAQQFSAAAKAITTALGWTGEQDDRHRGRLIAAISGSADEIIAAAEKQQPENGRATSAAQAGSHDSG
jgi:hypothetical protein